MLKFHIKGNVKMTNTVQLRIFKNKIKLRTLGEFNHYEEGLSIARIIKFSKDEKYEIKIDMYETPVRPYFIKGLIQELYSVGGMETITKNIKFTSESKAYEKYLKKVVTDAFDLLTK